MKEGSVIERSILWTSGRLKNQPSSKLSRFSFLKFWKKDVVKYDRLPDVIISHIRNLKSALLTLRVKTGADQSGSWGESFDS